MSYTNRDVALKIFTKSKGKWEVRSFGTPDKREEYYITSDDLGDVCNMLKNDPYSEFKAKHIVQMHNSFNELLGACKDALASIRWFGVNKTLEDAHARIENAIAKAEEN